MIDKTPKGRATAGADLPGAGFPYAVVETALAAVFDINLVAQRGWLRARIQHLRRLGLVPNSPGKGSAITYSQDDADKWLIAIELEHLLIDPAKVVDLITATWTARPFKRGHVFITEQESLKYQIQKARKAVAPEDHVMLLVVFGPLTTSAGMGFTTGSAEAGRLVARDDRDPAPARVAVLNLTARIKAFDSAIAKAQQPHVRPKLTGVAKQIVNAGRRQRGEPEL